MRRKGESIQAYRKRVAKRRAETKGKSVKTQLKETGTALKGLFKKKSKSKPGAKPRTNTTTKKAPAKPPLKAAKRSGPKVTGKDTKLGPLKGQSLLKQTVGTGKNAKLNVTKEQLKASGMSLRGYANYMKKHGKRPPRMSMLRKK
tara:strand:- start:254 stop:688 length:435 start_codon:yes stop_codon:yes gene_type:complete